MGAGKPLITPDLNLLIYSYDTSSPWHKKAAHWWTQCLSGTEPVGLPWVVSLGFIRIWTSSRFFANPMPIDLAIESVESWLNRNVVRPLDPGRKHASILFDFLRAEGRGGNLTTDAHLAALAVENRAVIHTADTDFARFPGVRTLNPLNARDSVSPRQRS